jgi:hypothetical protein
LPRFGAAMLEWGRVVIGRHYYVRQATTLLKFANSTTNPQLIAVLIEKAADLKSQTVILLVTIRVMGQVNSDGE